MLEEALKKFLESPGFPEAIVSSTQASWGGSGYSVELFVDGSYRVLWDGTIGNLYESPGVILRILPLADEEQEDVNENDGVGLLEVARFYADEIAADLKANLEERMATW